MRWLAVIILLAFGGGAHAQNCQRSRAVYTTYQAQAYYPTYAATVYVPKVVKVEVQRDHYYSIDPIGAIQRLLKQEREAWQATQEAPQPSQPAPPAPQPPPVVPAPQPTVLPQRTLFLDRNKPSTFQDASLVAVIQQSCVKCHNAEQKMPLLTPDGKMLLDLTRCAALDVYFRVNTGNMPKTAPPVDDKYMPLFGKWIEASK